MRLPIRYPWLMTIALLALISLTLCSVTVGTVKLSHQDVIGALGLSKTPVSNITRSIVIDLRLPRALLALLTGAVLAMVGALLQTTTRNKLADPFLFGLSSGASAGAVLVITRFGDHLGLLSLPLAAFTGGIFSAVAVLFLFHFKKQRAAEHLILCGLAISFIFSALTSYFVFSGDQRASSSVMFWSLGGLGLARWDNLALAVMSLILISGFVALRWRELDGLLAGDPTARSLGINVDRLRVEAFLCCALSTALLVALTGVIGFVGLMVPQLCRHVVGVRHVILLPFCAVAGATLLCGSDILSRTLLTAQELPIGIITAGVGGIFIIVMLTYRQL